MDSAERLGVSEADRVVVAETAGEGGARVSLGGELNFFLLIASARRFGGPRLRFGRS